MTLFLSHPSICDNSLVRGGHLWHRSHHHHHHLHKRCLLSSPSQLQVKLKQGQRKQQRCFVFPSLVSLVFIFVFTCLYVCIQKFVSTFNVVNNSYLFHNKYSKIGITVDKMSNGKELKLKLSLAIANLFFFREVFQSNVLWILQWKKNK